MSKHKTIPKKIRLELYEKYNNKCAYCGCDLEYKDMQVDHVKSVVGVGNNRIIGAVGTVLENQTGEDNSFSVEFDEHIGGHVKTHPCNAGENTSYLYDSEYVVLENYNPTEKLYTQADLDKAKGQGKQEALEEIRKWLEKK